VNEAWILVSSVPEKLIKKRVLVGRDDLENYIVAKAKSKITKWL